MSKTRFILIAFIALFTFQASAQKPVTLKGNELFGSLNARHIGPALMSGRITDITGHPTNSRHITIGTAGGGVWKSMDGGLSFTPLFDDYNQSIGCVALDPTDPDNVIWVGTGETWTRNSISPGDGLYKSKDGGKSWKKIGFTESDHISSIQINPENTDEVYVGILGPLWGDGEERGVYKTTDGGESWEQILKGDLSTGCSELILDPSDSNVLYAAFWEFRRTAWSFNSGGANSALYKSTDAGKTWKKIHNGFPEGDLGRFAITVAPSNSKVVYCVVESHNKSKSGLYRSDDAGESWEHLNKDFGLAVRPFYFSRIVVDPNNPDVVLKAGLSGSISRDGGKTFKALGPMHSDIHDLWFDVNNSDLIYSGTDGGLYRSYDGGTTFDMVNDLPLSQFYHVSVDNAEPYNIYGGLQDNGSWFGPSSSPGGIEAGDWTSVGAGDGFRVMRHPTKNIVYSEMQGAENIWRYDVDKNQTKLIKPLPVKGDPKLRFNWNAPIEISPNRPDRFYVGAQFLYRSEDMGDNWEKISPDLTTNNPAKQQQAQSGGISVDNSGAENNTCIFTIAESPLDENIIWVGTDDGLVQLTQDGGKTWTNITSNIAGLPDPIWCYHIEASNFHKGAAYAVFDGHTSNNNNAYVYKTTDFGQTWKSIVTDQIESFTRNIQEDYVNEDLLFLGTELGLYITIDGGESWNKFTNNMPATPVHYIALHKGTNDLVMGTHGRGIIIIDDISPLRHINQSLLQEKVKFLDSKPFIINEESSFGGNSTVSQFVGRNPSRTAKVIYYLKKRHTFGKMTLEVFNEAGELVSKLSPGKRKGINIVDWAYTMKAPKVAKGKTFSFASFASVQLPAGTYKVVMRKGKDTYESSIELIYNPKSGISDADRKFKAELVKKAYDLQQDLAYMVYEMDEILKYTEGFAKENSKAKKTTDKLSTALNTLKKSLVITTGDNYVGTAEPELREKIADIYALIAANPDRPSNLAIQNFDMHYNQFFEDKAVFNSLKKKHFEKLTKLALKAEYKAMKLKTFEEFVK